MLGFTVEKRKGGNRRVPTTAVSDLPIPILMDIFSRLPVKTVFICRALHMVPMDTAGILMRNSTSSTRSSSRGFQISHLPCIDVVNSCNGLLCLRTPIYDDPGMVCNPVTGEYVSIPRSKRKHGWARQHLGIGFTAFGFSFRTYRCKVIRSVHLFVSTPNDSYFHDREAEIFTVGEDSWRSIGPAPLFPFESSATVFSKGEVHWLCTDSKTVGSITSFNFEDEKFGEIPSPFHYKRGGCNVRMGILGECLYLTDIVSYDRFEVWVMKEYGVQDSWTKEFVIENQGLYVWPRGLYQPIKYLQNGDVLMFHPSNAFAAYNPSKKGFRCSMSEIWEDNEALHFVEEDKTKELDSYWISYPLI
ncbi:hypothetical protein SLEP1_g1820 [Rubroshorea leprosula]|uniref:F-box associated beta-propeller type 1 domain-containing protein n=1 Tax=Rubroshorea leprosula TaxID=152421 RepID=A0AAV5HEZ9_9ROSI|nr:hypothetical protein SLEP1_g1820 [Rubroshorea leprosula]